MEVDVPGKDDLEAECGITAFASALPGFTGILKHRYRDFQVAEVDAQGRLANLTSLSVPPEAVHEFFKSDPKVPPLMTGVVNEKAAPPPSSSSKPQGDGTSTQGSGQPTPPSTGRIFIKYIPTRTQRRDAAALASAAAAAGGAAPNGASSAGQSESSGPQALDAAGGPESANGREGRGGGGRGSRGGRGGGGRREGRGRGGRGDAQQLQHWGGGSDCKHVKFVLYKENQDTQAALSAISRTLRLGGPGSNARSIFGFAGESQPNFTEALVVSLALVVHASCAAVAAHGFVNYFGLQRFGTAGTPTHKVGAALLQGHFGMAVDLIMGEGFEDKDGGAGAKDSNNNSSSRGDRHTGHQQQKAPAALRLLPHWMVGERSLMEGLSRKQQQQQGSKRGGGPAGPQEGQNKRSKGNDGRKQWLQQGQQQQGQQQLGQEHGHKQQAHEQPQEEQQQPQQPSTAGKQEGATNMQGGATNMQGSATNMQGSATDMQVDGVEPVLKAAPAPAAAAPAAPPAAAPPGMQGDASNMLVEGAEPASKAEPAPAPAASATTPPAAPAAAPPAAAPAAAAPPAAAPAAAPPAAHAAAAIPATPAAAAPSAAAPAEAATPAAPAAAPTGAQQAGAAPGTKGADQRDKDPEPEAKPKAPFSESDYAGVLCMLPHSLRLMYLHAWQSRLWNLAASHRVQSCRGKHRGVAGSRAHISGCASCIICKRRQRAAALR
ncbi:hypothetical protein DUNSADRAFT_7723 [Dunaliella salina]|uniref:TRUD domain-containing protein n=1 Tax=Dunaliella salina TaxID=3046 RepID=A0ABQ7GKU3_DUNSA|nr:hypothetical protein DUNSADRAFT_7723 [Dunaliella salina]|eukprot:KAF5835235.1 hypothetical protein DUNSADRAFT_7723 [Dunaliella salina]